MLIYRTTRRAACAFIAFCFLFMFLFSAAPAARAEPAEESVTGWVDIQAHVPEGFKGSVSVALENKATGETQIVTSYYLNDYSNSVQIPLGEYIVVSAFTSENSLVYEAFTKTENFTLKDGFSIDVTVTHNPEGEGILAKLIEEPNAVPETTEDPYSESADTIKSETEASPESTAYNTESEQNKETTKPETDEIQDEGEDDEEEDKGVTLAKAAKNILLTIAATLAFLLGTVLLVVYVRFKFGSD